MNSFSVLAAVNVVSYHSSAVKKILYETETFWISKKEQAWEPWQTHIVLSATSTQPHAITYKYTAHITQNIMLACSFDSLEGNTLYNNFMLHLCTNVLIITDTFQVVAVCSLRSAHCWCAERKGRGWWFSTPTGPTKYRYLFLWITELHHCPHSSLPLTHTTLFRLTAAPRGLICCWK